MNIHEFQAKELFRRYEIPVPRGRAVHRPEDAVSVWDELGAPVAVVKAQIHAGGRGKAGGVKLARSREEVAAHAGAIFGKTLVTPQTGPSGRVVRRLLVEEGVEIAREFYLSLLLDRGTRRPAIVASAEGGVEIEEVAARDPSRIHQAWIDPAMGYQAYQGRLVASQLGLPPQAASELNRMLARLYRLLAERHLLQIEINPLVLTRSGDLIALDAKVVADDNGLPLHPDVQQMRDRDEEEPLETRATDAGLNYVKLDGTIGCMVNGAGLAMATMDLIQLAGGRPANFLDVGGGASVETVRHAFSILLDDPSVRGVFVNIFGGIVRCERIAGGIIDAAKAVEIRVPVVVRLEGTNVELGRRMLAESGLAIEPVGDLWEAARRIVARTRR